MGSNDRVPMQTKGGGSRSGEVTNTLSATSPDGISMSSGIGMHHKVGSPSGCSAGHTGTASPRGQIGAFLAPPDKAHQRSRDENPFNNLPLLRDTAAGDRPELLRKKLNACCYIYDFRQPDACVKEKEAKRITLLEIVDYVNSFRNVYTEHVMQDIVYMVSMNIFRALPASGVLTVVSYDPEEEEPALEPAWTHLQIVYEFFLRFIVSNEVDPKIAKKFIGQTFVVKVGI
eukprot:TRINITY_DN6575_c0_g1_i3.p2 TRINITY_DN6575_c0_g1~~TRINITY_DN6575_c0_g1_i3.p2  ORF type:complete len:230 (+),score=9.56 TRINITY_DN6575_c0_g1_i3:235-924(+)